MTSVVIRRRLLCRGDRRHARPARDCARQVRVPPRRHDECRGDGAHGRQGDARDRRRPHDHDQGRRRAGRHRAASRSPSARIGAPAPTWSRRCGVRSTSRRSACRAAPSACNGSPSIARRARSRSTCGCPNLVRPNSTLRVPVKVNGLNAGEEARIVVAAVDVGILNLTNYKPPSPDDYYLGQRRLSAEVRDLYGQLIDGMQGTRGQIRTGGDGGSAALTGTPADAAAARAVLRPRHGRRRMARLRSHSTFRPSPAACASWRSAWSKDKVGHASGDVIVRDPVVLTATLPRFLLTGDRGSMRLEVDNVEGQAGDYRLDMSTQGPLAVGQGAPQTMRLAAKQRSGVSLPLTRDKRRRRHGRGPHHRARRLRSRAQLYAGRQAGDADPHAPHGEAAGQGRKPVAVERPVQRPRAGDRQRGGFGRALDRARCRGAAAGARPLSVRLLRADHQPRAAAALCQ